MVDLDDHVDNQLEAMGPTSSASDQQEDKYPTETQIASDSIQPSPPIEDEAYSQQSQDHPRLSTHHWTTNRSASIKDVESSPIERIRRVLQPQSNPDRADLLVDVDVEAQSQLSDRGIGVGVVSAESPRRSIHSREEVMESPGQRRTRESLERRQRRQGQGQSHPTKMGEKDMSHIDQFIKGKKHPKKDNGHYPPQNPIKGRRKRQTRQTRERQRKCDAKEATNGEHASELNPTRDGGDDDNDSSDYDDDDDSFEYMESPGAFGVRSVGVDQYGKGRLTQQPNRKSLPRLLPLSDDSSPSLPVVSEGRPSSSNGPLISASYHGRCYERGEESSEIFGDTLHLSLHSRDRIAARVQVVASDPMQQQRSQHDRHHASHPTNTMPTSMDETPVGDTPTANCSVSLVSSTAEFGRSMVRAMSNMSIGNVRLVDDDEEDEGSVKADDNCCHRQNRFLWLIVIALVLVIAIGFGLGVGLPNSSESSGLRSPAPPPDLNPTAAPNHNKDNMMRLGSLRAWIVDEGISDAESLENPDSAPYRALDWLAFHDPLQLPVPVVENSNSTKQTTAMTHNHQAFLERYVALVLYFATNERLDFRVKEESVCSWHTNDNKGIYCRGENDSTSNNAGVTHISLPQAFLSGYFPLELCSLPNLVHIDFSHNSLADLPDNIGKCSQLEYLLLGDNPWVLGTENKGFPSTFFELTNLKDLQLYRSFLQASIPSTIGRLTRLEVLQMKSNKIYGTIPSQLWDLSTLQVLNLGYNDIEGEISSSISNTNLTHLLLGTNILEGTLPSQIGELTNLVQLDLSSNYLSGAVPNELASLSNLVALDLSFNFDLSGSLDGLCNSTMILPQNDTDTTIETPSFFASEPLVCSCCTKI
mmetsp:Transcript_10012/g.23852  ORF Transcript_10012/g.23852 Transcript_10012/m.23852 type:complete len:871 (-) Transcript_10012:206-2818(-)